MGDSQEDNKVETSINENNVIQTLDTHKDEIKDLLKSKKYYFTSVCQFSDSLQLENDKLFLPWFKNSYKHFGLFRKCFLDTTNGTIEIEIKDSFSLIKINNFTVKKNLPH